MATTYEKIATTTLGSAAATITFSSIAASYTDLKISFLVNGVSSQAAAGIRFNSDTATNYSYTSLYGSGASAGSTAGTSSNRIYLSGAGGVPTSSPAFYEINIFSYAGSTYKTTLDSASIDANGSGFVERVVGLWRSTSAITSITLLIDGTVTFNTGTIATLYGILKA